MSDGYGLGIGPIAAFNHNHRVRKCHRHYFSSNETSPCANRGVEEVERHEPLKAMAEHPASQGEVRSFFAHSTKRSAERGPAQAGIGCRLIIGVLDKHFHFAADALQPCPHNQRQNVLGFLVRLAPLQNGSVAWPRDQRAIQL